VLDIVCDVCGEEAVVPLGLFCAGISDKFLIFAEMLIHFHFGENWALLGQEISKGHAGFFREFY
jgi:hypothetical protein